MIDYDNICYPDEIAEKLCGMAFDNPNEQIVNECKEAIYYLKAAAENPYNRDYFRTFYDVLQKITNRE